MAKIQKGFARSIAVLGILGLVCGFGVAICSWILAVKTSKLEILKGDESTSSIHTSDITVFGSYWWGGFFYLIPGFLAIGAGWTRKVVFMVFYIIFNILCLLASSIACVMVTILIILWTVIDTLLQSKSCIDDDMDIGCICSSRNLTLSNSTMGTNDFIIKNASCSNLFNIGDTLTAIVVLACISTLMAAIAAYLSCCALCNQEDDDSVTITYQPGPYGVSSWRRGTYQKL